MTQAQTEKTVSPEETKSEAPAQAKSQPELAKSKEVKAAPLEEKKAAPKEISKETPAEGPKRVTVKGDDEDIPEDADLLELTPRALKSRLDRYTRKQLRDRFGSDDFDTIKVKLDRLTELEAKEEERARADMSEKQRVEADLQREKARADAATEKLNTLYRQQTINKEDDRITKLAEKYLDPDCIDVQLDRLARHLNDTYNAKEIRTLKDKVIEKWFEELVQSKPKFGKDYDGTQQAKVQPKVGFTNGTNVEPPQKSLPSASAKTYAPGRANSMSTVEAKAAAAKEGLRW